MTPHYADDLVTLHHGDCLDVLASLPARSVDAVVTDPPYGIGFMGKEWDHQAIREAHERDKASRKTLVPESASRPGRAAPRSSSAFGDPAIIAGPVTGGLPFQEWCESWATECLRILRPGGHLLTFGGSRTWHRLACAVEDAGFEIRDSIAWLYGSGFPKSLDVSKAIDKAAGAERERVATGPAVKRMIPGADQNRTGSWIKDDGREYQPGVEVPATAEAERWNGWGTALKPAFEPIVVGRKPLVGTVAANVLQHGTGALNIDACRTPSDGSTGDRTGEASAERRCTDGGGTNFAPTPGPRGGDDRGRWPTNVTLDDDQAAELDRQTGILTSGANPTRRGADKFRDAYGDFKGKGQEACEAARGADAGGASRFFPTFRYEAKAPTAERPRDGEVAHPTVKPLDLMRWLVRLVTPPGGTVLEPFAGSGTTAEACVIEGFRCIAIEREATYLPLIVARLSKPIQPVMFGEPA